jgi:hypothetical protein
MLQEIEGNHRSDFGTPWGHAAKQICPRCNIPWPCDASRLVSRLKLAVEALEKISTVVIAPETAPGVAYAALVRIADKSE